jgi:hypothetical protein
MEDVLKALNVQSVEISQTVTLNVLNIESINDIISKYIDETLIEIYSKGHDTDIKIVKIKLKKYFDSKTKGFIDIGSIAEFFTHLFLNLKQYQQECLYKNLEENSIKKGFDGFYSKDGEIWIMESKSGLITTKDISHKSKIYESYNDLSKKLSGKCDSNNPWENAYSHAMHAGTNQDILHSIKKLEDMYTLKQFTGISEYNIIPSSSIFYQIDDFEHIDFESLKKDIIIISKNKKFKKLNIICINKKTKNLFLEYISN